MFDRINLEQVRKHLFVNLNSDVTTRMVRMAGLMFDRINLEQVRKHLCVKVNSDVTTRMVRLAGLMFDVSTWSRCASICV
jgi:hypothetical protein